MADLDDHEDEVDLEEILIPTQRTAVRISTIAAATKLWPSP